MVTLEDVNILQPREDLSRKVVKPCLIERLTNLEDSQLTLSTVSQSYQSLFLQALFVVLACEKSVVQPYKVCN